VKGRTVDEIMKDGDDDSDDHAERVPRWTLRREYRSTYRDHLAESETLVDGEWVERASFDDEAIPISIEKGIAEDLSVGLDDEIVFDVQGIPMTTRVASIREVDWRRVQANFFVVFPAGVLEDAPGFHIVTTRVADSAQSARMQRAVVDRYPNVSSIDLTLILQVIDDVVGRISFGIQFMALFTVFTGVVLLVTAITNSRYQRLGEGVLLRTLGATRAQILKIQFAEYLFLGVMASLTGATLAVAADAALAKFVFEIEFTFPLVHVVVAMLANIALTCTVGLVSSLGITRRSPLAVLRAEG
jgi:putative ABC transport system permease protein